MIELWARGQLGLYDWEVEYSEEPDKYGIYSTRVTKIHIWMKDDHSKIGTMCLYNKCWVVFPKNDVVLRLCNELVKQYK